MSNRAPDLVAKVTFLEETLGAQVHYRLMDPPAISRPPTHPQDLYVSIQAVTRAISDFLGISGLTFIVGVARQADDVSGHIELKYAEKNIFIEIAGDVLEVDDAILAVLGHEITHKCLYDHQIRCTSWKDDYEVLTDVAAVYLGLGKLMLNGCETRWTSEIRDTSGTTTQYHTLKVGYILRDDVAFVYRLVGALRNTTAEVLRDRISQDSLMSLEACERNYSSYFSLRSTNLTEQVAVAERLTSELSKFQTELAEVDWWVRRIRAECFFRESACRDMHKLIARTREMLERIRSGEEVNPALAYLRCLQAHIDVVKRNPDELRTLMDPDGHVARPTSDPSEEGFEIVNCPLDKTHLRVPTGKRRMLVKCSTCRYCFVVDTSWADNSSLKHTDRNGILHRIRSFMRRKGS